jgi:hypothetical protein
VTTLATCWEPGIAALVALVGAVVYVLPLVVVFRLARRDTRGRLFVTAGVAGALSLIPGVIEYDNGGRELVAAIVTGSAVGAALGVLNALHEDRSQADDFVRHLMLGAIFGTAAIGLALGGFVFAFTATGACIGQRDRVRPR